MTIVNNKHFPNFYNQNSAADNLPSVKTSSSEYSKSDWIKNRIFTDDKKIYSQIVITDDKKIIYRFGK